MENHTQKKNSTVEELKETADGSYKIKSVNPFPDKKMPSDQSKNREDDFKSRKREFSAYSRPLNVKRKCDDKEMTPSLSCYQMVPKIENPLETSVYSLSTQEASINPIEMNIGKNLQAPARKEIQKDQLKSEGELDAGPTYNVGMNGSQNPNGTVEPTLAEFKIDQAVVKCLLVLIDKVVYDHEIEVGILLSLQAFPQSNVQKTRKKTNSTPMSLDRRNSERRNREFSAYSRRPNAKRKFDDKEMTPSLSCNQIVPKIECSLETSVHCPSTQESSINPILLNIGKDLQAPAGKEKTKDQLKSEGELDTGPTFNVGMNGSRNPNEPVEPTLVDFKIDQAVVNCLQVLIDKVVYDHEIEVGILLSLQALPQSNEQKTPKKINSTPMSLDRSKLPTLLHGMDAQSNFESLNGSSSQKIVKIQLEKKPEVGYATTNSLLKRQRIKKIRNDFQVLLSVLNEVERMNNRYRKDMIKTNRALTEIHRLIDHMQENLYMIRDLSSHTITINTESEPCRKLNVLNQGLKIVQYLVKVQKQTDNFSNEFNSFRLQFHELSSIFLLSPLEEVIDSRQNEVLDKVLEASKLIYTNFFGNDFDLAFEKIKSNLKALQRYVEEFNNYLDILAELSEQLKYSPEYEELSN